MKWAGNLGQILIKLGQSFLYAQAGLMHHELKLEDVIKLCSPEGFIYFDLKYRTTDIETFERIIKLDWVDTKKYIKDFFDCDDFALAFKSHMSEIYKINAVMVCIGEMRNKNTNALIGYHAYNRFIDKHLKLFLFEPQTDQLSESNIIGDYVYNDFMRFL